MSFWVTVSAILTSIVIIYAAFFIVGVILGLFTQ